jgi:nicotinic acid phosphoribosyltransferase
MGKSEKTTNKSAENRLLRHMVGGSETSALMTDAYKFSMAQAGDPLRTETFYLSFRRPGLYLVPFDFEALIGMLLPGAPTRSEEEFLARHGYELSDDARKALSGTVEVWAAPKGTWVQEREPIVRVTGPSLLVSWLESLVIWLQFPIQVATDAAVRGRRHYSCTCEDEAEIVRLTLEAVGLAGTARIEVNPRGYAKAVRGNAKRLAKVLGGNLTRVFEVGMRGATCMQMHRIALKEVLRLGVAGSSNVYLAEELALIPVGTTGHEHQLRFADDASAFRAVRDGRSAVPSYLFDTFDALGVGIPAAIEVLRENPDRAASVRFDSGDTRAQVEAFLAAKVKPTFIFMDGIDDRRAAELCRLKQELDPDGTDWLFGVGGYLVGRATSMNITRDRVSAVYKLCQSGDRAVMKFSVPGKESLPGKPVVWRVGNSSMMQTIIAQEGERLGVGVRLATESSLTNPPNPSGPPQLSKATKELVRALRAEHLGAAPEDQPTLKIRNFPQPITQEKGTQL